jgi:hypothetical protein
MTNQIKVRPVQSTNKEQMIHLTFYFIRHGFSRANCVKSRKRLGAIRHHFIRDPDLTQWAKDHMPTHQAPDVDIVCTSSLYRAIQTALRMFPSHPVHVVPFVREQPSISFSNRPREVAKQQQRMTPTERSRVDYRYILQEQRDSPNPAKAMAWLSYHLPLLLYEHGLLCSKGKEFVHVRVGIVTHKHWVKAFTKGLLLDNVGQVELKATWSIDTGLVFDARTSIIREKGVPEPPRSQPVDC